MTRVRMRVSCDEGRPSIGKLFDPVRSSRGPATYVRLQIAPEKEHDGL